MSAAAASTDAVKEREALASEFAELQALERALDSYGATARAFESHSDELKEVHREAAARAFGDYDLNKNGFIELNELAYLTAELGYPMDAKELQSALKAINTSGTGQITPAEFEGWWHGTATATAQRDGLAVGLLRARLLQHKGEKLIAQIGKRKGVHFPDAKAWDTKDAKTSTLALNVGEFGDAKGGVHVRFHHNLILDPDIVNSDAKYNFFFSTDVKHTGKADFPGYLSELLKAAATLSDGAFVASVSTPKKDVVRVTTGFPMPMPGDPQQLIESFGFPVEQLSKALRLDVEVGTSVSDVFGKEKYTLADLIKFRLKSHFHIEKAMLATAIAAMSGMANNRDAQDLAGILPFLMATDVAVNVTAGEVVEVINGLAEYARGKFGDQSRQMKDLKPFMTVVQDQITSLVRKERPRDRNKELPIAISAFRTAVLTYNRDIVEFLQQAFWTRSGVGVSLELDHIIRVPEIVAAAEWFDDQVADLYKAPLDPQQQQPGAMRGGPRHR